MILGLDYYDNLEVPSFILCKPNGDRIESINCTKKNGTIKFNDYNEIKFCTYLYIDNKKNTLYDRINELMYVELPDIGMFVIDNISLHSEGNQDEYKECTAASKEVLLAQKYLELFTINMGTIESIDGVQFVNLSDPSKSLMHLVLEKCPDWSIGHVDNELYTIQRCFEVSRQDIYSFLKQDVSKAFECIFEFDTLKNKINIYKEKNVGKDTNIHISYCNLAKSVDISSSIDNIKTQLKITGADDLNIREVNMGYDSIVNIDYFHSLEYMSQETYDAYSKWKILWDSKVKDYEKLVTEYQDYYKQIHYQESEMMPDDPESKDWTQYGLNPLKEKLAANEQIQAVMIKAGQAEPSHKDYSTMYLPVFNEINELNEEINVRETTINSLKDAQSVIGDQMVEIINLVSMSNPDNFTQKQLNELQTYIREDELSSDNYIVTDTMTDSERMDMLYDMLEYGKVELEKVSVPTMQFSMDMLNIYSIPEFQNKIKDFNVGNYIYVSLRDDFSVKLRLLTIDINFLDSNDFSVTFGNIAKKKGSKIFEDITKALDISTSTATTVSFNSSYWNQANVESTKIGKVLSDGLIAAGERIKTAKSDVEIDDRGIFIKNNPNSQYADDVIFLGGGQIVFSDDSLKTVKTAIGRVQYTKKGVTYDDFGLLAQFVIAGYVGGSIIEGDEIIGGSITGTKFDNGNGTFSVDENGYIKASSGNIAGWELSKNAIYNGIAFTNEKNNNSTGMGTNGGSWAFWAGNGKFSVKQDGSLIADNATIAGHINATSGTIGGANGFTIETGKIYSGIKSTLTDANSGVYIGTNGISLGANSPFNVTSAGVLTAKSGTIGGATITSNSIHSSNNNWHINSDGSATFKNVYITGVNSGSTFGSIGYDGSLTWGNFGGGSYYGSTVSNPFSGGCVTHIQSISADYIYANYLKAMKADIDAIEANYIDADYVSARYATINSLNAATARIDAIEANYIDADYVSARYAKISTVEALEADIGTLSAADVKIKNRLSATEASIKTLKADLAEVNSLHIGNVSLGLGVHEGVQVVTWVYA